MGADDRRVIRRAVAAGAIARRNEADNDLQSFCMLGAARHLGKFVPGAC